MVLANVNSIAREYGIAGPSGGKGEAALLALLADPVLFIFVGLFLGGKCWVKINMIAIGFLNICQCCALRLEGRSQLGTIPICVSSESRTMPY